MVRSGRQINLLEPFQLFLQLYDMWRRPARTTVHRGLYLLISSKRSPHVPIPLTINCQRVAVLNFQLAFFNILMRISADPIILLIGVFIKLKLVSSLKTIFSQKHGQARTTINYRRYLSSINFMSWFYILRVKMLILQLLLLQRTSENVKLLRTMSTLVSDLITLSADNSLKKTVHHQTGFLKFPDQEAHTWPTTNLTDQQNVKAKFLKCFLKT